MNNILYPLVSHPIPVNSAGFSGRLFIDGNTESNCILFRFRFDKNSKPAPVFVSVNAAGKSYQFLCGIRDFTNPDMKSPVIEAKFSLSDGIELIEVAPLVNFSKKL
jgi:hypothetical protein